MPCYLESQPRAKPVRSTTDDAHARLAADAVALVHLAFVLFVAFGGLLVWRAGPAGVAPCAAVAWAPGSNSLAGRARSPCWKITGARPSARPVTPEASSIIMCGQFLPGGADPRRAMDTGGGRPVINGVVYGVRWARWARRTRGGEEGLKAIRLIERSARGRPARRWRTRKGWLPCASPIGAPWWKTTPVGSPRAQRRLNAQPPLTLDGKPLSSLRLSYCSEADARAPGRG